MNKLIVQALVIVFATSLSATASAQSMPSLSSLMEQFGMGKSRTNQIAGAKLPQLPTTVSAPKLDGAQAQQQRVSADEAEASKYMDCFNASANEFGAKVDDLAKQLSATKEGTVSLTAEQIAFQDEFIKKLPIDKDSVVTRGKFALTAEQEQITSAFIKNNSDFSSLSQAKCVSKK